MPLNMKEGLYRLWDGTYHQETADNTCLQVFTEANLSTYDDHISSTDLK